MDLTKDNNGDLNERYRTVVRSTILRRIYDKNLNLEQTNEIGKIGFENHKQEYDDDDEDNRELENRIAQKIKIQLTNEWRKTLERVLDHHGYLDSKLEASRKDALKFFLTSDWSFEEKKRKARLEHTDLQGALTERRSKTPWSEIISKSDQVFLLTNDFELSNSTDPRLKSLGVRQIARLIRENLENQLQSFQPSTLVERMALRVASTNLDQAIIPVPRSQWYRLVTKTLSWLKPTQEVELNNHRLMLSLSSIHISFTRHPLMTQEDRLVRQLVKSFKTYQKSESQCLKLRHLNQQIVLLTQKIQGAQEETAEVQMNVNLIKRLVEEKQNLVLERRKSLINLLQKWSNFQNQLNDDSRLDLQQIDLKLDEIENIDFAQEKAELEKLVQQRIELENLIKQIDKDLVVNKDEITQNCYLDDGRLPGEPKFADIDLKLADYKYNYLNLFYYIEVYIGEKLLATLEPKRLTQSFELTWTRTVSYPLPFPCQYNAILEPKLPVLHLIEKLSLNNRKNTIISKIFLKKFPEWNRQEALKFEFDFTNNEVKNKDKTEGWLEGLVRWSSLPINANSELMSYYDEEKRQIKSLIELEQIDQWLHDLRYKHQDQARQIELMQLLLKQRYQLELESLYEKRKEGKKTELVEENQELDSCSFCTDNDIEDNQRFRLMQMRHEGNALYGHYRFMPLTITDVLLTELNPSQPRKTSFELLLDFLSSSSEAQETRLKGEDSLELVKINHEWCQEKNWYHTASRLLNQNRQHGHNLEHFYLEMNDDHHDKLLFRREVLSRSEIIKEQPIDTFSSADFTLFQTFTLSQRKLNPSRKDRRKAAINILDALDRDIQIVLVIQHANNVPFKVQDESKEDFVSSSTFIEIKLDQNQTLVTSIADGAQPTWNESFKLKIKLDARQAVCLNLFARDSSTSVEDGSVGDADRCWLGQLRIPLTLLLFNSKLEGTFRLTSPYFLRTYKSARKQSNFLFNRSIDSSEENESTGKSKLASTVEQMQTLYSKDGELCSLLGSLPEVSLSVFVTTDPSIDSTINSMQENASLESVDLLDYCHRWKSSLQSHFPNRRFLYLVTNLQHKTLLSIRFLCPIKPPSFDELNLSNLNDVKIGKKKTKANLKKLIHKESFYLSLIIRYVSLVAQAQEPNQLDAKQIHRWSKADLWMDVSQMLTFRVGSQVEHAILLCCFLLYLDRKASLLIGSGLLDGPTAYVILFPTSDQENEMEPVIIDPKRGHQFATKDYGITLISVDCVITTDNVYANIQKSTHPNRMNFNLHKSNHWQPLFGKKDFAKFENLENKIQPNVVDFGVVSRQLANNLEQKLESQLREQLMNWRRQLTGSYTPINRATTEAIKRILPKLEQHSCLVGHQFYATHLLELENMLVREFDQILDIHKLIGYPIHLSYRDPDQIAKLVHSTGIHQTHFGQPNSCEYVIAVHVQPYPAQVYSIWLYVGALVPKTIVS